jgi:hypothetical protein
MGIESVSRTKEKSLLLALGVIPIKVELSVKEFLHLENQSEEKLDEIREPAQQYAAAILNKDWR